LKFDLIIPTFNRSKSLKKTLTGIQELSLDSQHSYEVVIVDNNSTDNTKEMVQQFSGKSWIGIKYLLEEKKGKINAIHKAVDHAKGDVLVFTDDDVTFDQNWLKIIAENFRDKLIHCVTGKIIPVYEEEKPCWYSEKLSTVLGLVDYSGEKRKTDQITGANFAILKSVFEQVGGFTVYDGLINEDTFLTKKLLKGGFNIIYDPRMVVYHHFQKEKFTKEYFRRWYWLSGRSIAVIHKEKDLSLKRNIAGVPFWRIKEASQHFQKMLINFFNEKERFYYELQFRRLCGFIGQRWKDRTSKEGKG